MKRISNQPRGLRVVALTVAMGLAIIGLSQCRFVEDTVSGVDLKTNSGLNARSTCVRDCNEQFKECKRAEEELYKANKRACKDLKDSAERKQCEKAENQRHQDANEACEDAKKNCKGGCYNEGSGGAGR